MNSITELLETPQAIFELLDNPQMVHAAVVHLPIALAVLGVPLVLVASLVSTKGDGTRWIGVLVYLALAAIAYGAVLTGQQAEAHAQAGVSEAASERVHEHEEMAEKAWGFGVATALLLALSTIANPHGAGRGKPLRKIFMVLAVAASLATAGWVGVTAHYGGTLVYEFGVGVNQESGEEASGSETGLHLGSLDEFTPAVLPYSEQEAAQVSFSRDVAPILSERCGGCHGAETARAGLRLSSAQAILEGGASGPAILAGQPDKSLLVERIRGIAAPKMPLGLDELSADELKTIHMWIAAGARAD